MSHGHEPPPRRPYRRPELRELTREEAEEKLGDRLERDPDEQGAEPADEKRDGTTR
jgi:hypothetical protein